MKTNKAFLEGQRLFLRGDYLRSIASFSSALAAGLDAEQVHAPLGMAYFKNANFPEAIEEFSSALEFDPTNDYLLFLRGMAFFNNEDTVTALEDFNLALRFNPWHAQTYVARSLVLRAMQRDGEAEYDLKTAIEIGGVEVELFIREYCATPQVHGLAMMLFDAERVAWGRELRADRLGVVH